MILAEFLLARITEDDETAQVELDTFAAPDGDLQRFVREKATRVLAECEAKRQIVEQYAKESHAEDWEDGSEQRGAAVALGWACRVLALPYADHPDYREEWRP